MALGLEITKPFAIASVFTSLREWRFIQAAALALAGGLAIAYSIQAERTFMSMTRGDLVAERAGDADAAKKAEARYGDRLTISKLVAGKLFSDQGEQSCTHYVKLWLASFRPGGATTASKQSG